MKIATCPFHSALVDADLVDFDAPARECAICRVQPETKPTDSEFEKVRAWASAVALGQILSGHFHAATASAKGYFLALGLSEYQAQDCANAVYSRCLSISEGRAS